MWCLSVSRNGVVATCDVIFEFGVSGWYYIFIAIDAEKNWTVTDVNWTIISFENKFDLTVFYFEVIVITNDHEFKVWVSDHEVVIIAA